MSHIQASELTKGHKRKKKKLALSSPSLSLWGCRTKIESINVAWPSYSTNNNKEALNVERERENKE